MTRIVVASLFLLNHLLAVPVNASQTPTNNPNQLVKSAFETMQKLSSYKAYADLAVGNRRARIEAEVGIGKVAISMLGFDGKRSRNIITNQEFFLSTDEGKTWKKDTEKYGLLRYNLISGVLEPSIKLHQQGEWKVIGKETIEAVETLHLRLFAPSLIDIWVAEDAALGSYVRRVHVIVEGNDGELDNTVTYFDLNQPVNIVVPK